MWTLNGNGYHGKEFETKRDAKKYILDMKLAESHDTTKLRAGRYKVSLITCDGDEYTYEIRKEVIE